MDSHNLDYPLRLIPQSKNGPTSQDPVNGYPLMGLPVRMSSNGISGLAGLPARTSRAKRARDERSL